MTSRPPSSVDKHSVPSRALVDDDRLAPTPTDGKPAIGSQNSSYRKQRACRRVEAGPRLGNGKVFSKGRDFAAWLGLVPRQISTEDRTILGKRA
jgi:hypothetical protein